MSNLKDKVASERGKVLEAVEGLYTGQVIPCLQNPEIPRKIKIKLCVGIVCLRIDAKRSWNLPALRDQYGQLNGLCSQYLKGGQNDGAGKGITIN